MTTLFTNGNLVDVIGQTVLTGGSILVENGMIKEVGTSIAAPDGAKVVDLGGRTVLPGLFNCMYICAPMPGPAQRKPFLTPLSPSGPLRI